jgi:hypothetical protein
MVNHCPIAIDSRETNENSGDLRANGRSMRLASAAWKTNVSPDETARSMRWEHQALTRLFYLAKHTQAKTDGGIRPTLAKRWCVEIQARYFSPQSSRLTIA